MANYFVDFAVEKTKKELTYLRNYKSDRFLFRLFNLTRINYCSANGILRQDGIPYAIKCNCGHFTYHPVVDGVVMWKIIVKEKSKSLIKERIDQAIVESWIIEE